jgi:hypothetical protein
VVKFCQDSRFSDQDLGLSKYAAGPLLVYWHFERDSKVVQESQPHTITQLFSLEDVINVIDVSLLPFADKQISR